MFLDEARKTDIHAIDFTKELESYPDSVSKFALGKIAITTQAANDLLPEKVWGGFVRSFDCDSKATSRMFIDTIR